MSKANPSKIPAASSITLTNNKAGPPKKENYYRSLISMLNFLVNATHPELAYAIH